MGQSNVLLRIHYVKDFPLHTLLLEIRKGYFMEPENKFATAEEKEKKNRWKFVVSSRQRTMKERSQGGWAEMIASRFLFIHLFISPSLSFFVLVAMFQIRAWSFFGKCVALMHFKSPFFRAQYNIAIEVLVVPLEKVAQSLSAVLHCAPAEDILAQRLPSFLFIYFISQLQLELKGCQRAYTSLCGLITCYNNYLCGSNCVGFYCAAK